MQRKVPPPWWRRGATAATYVFIVSLLLPVAARDDGLRVSRAWIREAPPGVAMLAGYFNVTNRGDEPLALIGARSERFETVEIHVSRIVDGVARMRRLSRVEIGPGETAAFAPGGRHLMLMQPDDALAAGDCVVVTLMLDGGAEVDVKFEVRRE